MSTCQRCGHPPHQNTECQHPITETIRDDIGIFTRPSGLKHTLIVDICGCESKPTR